MEKKTILVVEDEKAIADILVFNQMCIRDRGPRGKGTRRARVLPPVFVDRPGMAGKVLLPEKRLCAFGLA